MNVEKRRFELIEGSASKFWEVALEGASFTVTYGRIGTPGVSKTTSSPDAQSAQVAVEKLIREKCKKGYQELGASEQNFRPPAHISTSQPIDRFLNYKVVNFVPGASGEPGEGPRRELPALRELDKLVYAVAITYDDEPSLFLERLDALLIDPKVSELRALLLGCWFVESCESGPLEACERLIRHASKLTSLRGLFVGDIVQEEQEISWIFQTDCAPVLHALPMLEELVVRGGQGLRFSGLKHPNLRSLTVQTGGLPVEVVRDLMAAELPNLQRLTLWLGVEEYGGDSKVTDFAPLLSGECFPKLEHLGLQDSEYADELALALARSPLLARLKGLDLSMGTLSDVGGEALLESPAVRTLKHLNLRYHYMSPATTAKFRALGIEVNVSDRQEVEDKDERYVEVSE